MDYIDELHRLYQRRRPASPSRCYIYRTAGTLHLHFRSSGCCLAKCLCCDYGCAQRPLSKADIDLTIDEVFGASSTLPSSLLLGSLGSILDQNEFDRDLLAHLLRRISDTGIDDITIESSWWDLDSDTINFVLRSLLNASITFECGLESSSEAVRNVCHAKPIAEECIRNAVQAVHNAGARISANVMLGAPFLSIRERMQDAHDSISWALCDLGVDEVVLFPVNVRPYTALRALYDLALYEPTNLWEVVETLLQLPTWALGRTHIAWWGERSTDYSLGNIPPSGCETCTGVIRTALSEYAKAALLEPDAAAAVRNRILSNLVESDVANCSCRKRFEEVGLPSLEELMSRRATVCERAARGGDAHLVWVSPRESDLNVAASLFVGSSTVYGSNERGNRSYSSRTGWRENHNDVTRQQIDSMSHDQACFAKDDPNVRFMSYNPYYTHGGNTTVLDRTVCLNDKAILTQFSDKRTFRQFAQRYVQVPDFLVLRRSEISTNKLVELFPSGAVIQRGISSGGEGTYVVLQHQELPTDLDEPDERLLISSYYPENVPINVHALVYDQDIVVFPASTQLIDARDGKLMYCGSDYVSFNDLSANIRRDFYQQTRILCAQIQEAGYRGLLGLDAMVCDGKVLFLEMNARFQASSHALNHALHDKGLPTLQEFQREAFQRATSSVDIAWLEHLEVPYSTFSYSSHGSHELDIPFEHLLKVSRAARDIEVFDDGLELTQPRRLGAYLFGILVRGRVSAIFFNRHLSINQNVSCRGPRVNVVNVGDDDAWIRLKIALLNQGCVVSREAAEYMQSVGGVREGVNDAIDLELFGHVVNVPIGMPHQELSPFSLRVSAQGELTLFAYDEFVSSIAVSYRDQVQGLLTPSGTPVDRICLLATDRVRVQHHDCCDVAERGLRCKFCNFPSGRMGFGLKDIDFAIEAYLSSGIPFRHFLVGGGTDLSPNTFENTLAVVRSISSRCDKPIYLMDIPPLAANALESFKEAGVTEVAFNIEVFDREIARKVMPLKGRIPLSQYLEALDRAVALWGADGAVRSALVVGIEPLTSTLNGIELLASRGVAPILSVFRPVAHSLMADMVGPDNAWLLSLYTEASAICARYGLELGPQCEACRNNVLAP